MYERHRRVVALSLDLVLHHNNMCLTVSRSRGDNIMTQIMSQTKGPEDQQLQGQQLQGAKRPWSKPTLTAVDIKAKTHSVEGLWC